MVGFVEGLCKNKNAFSEFFSPPGVGRNVPVGSNATSTRAANCQHATIGARVVWCWFDLTREGKMTKPVTVPPPVTLPQPALDQMSDTAKSHLPDHINPPNLRL
jgi:hypothetical protein